MKFFAYIFCTVGTVITVSYGLVVPEVQRRFSHNPLENNFIPYEGPQFKEFDWNLWKVMTRKYTGNILISPLSLKIALVLIWEGAQEETARELASILQLPGGNYAARNKFSVILRSLQPFTGEVPLKLGTRIYLDDSISLKQSYASVIKTFYSTDIVSSNFADALTVPHDVNSWVRNLTNGRIEKMIENESTLENPVMLVMNALFFKGIWQNNEFPAQETRSEKFYESSGNIIDVPFMKAVGEFNYVESPELDAKILKIPYLGQKMAMYIVLPRTQDGLDTVIKNINSHILMRLVRSMQIFSVEIKLPKFNLEYTSHMEPVLREMGIKSIFTNTATLTGIAKAKRGAAQVLVSDIVQKAAIEVDEGSSYVGAAANLGSVPDRKFIASHPFLFYVEDEITGTILYMGRMENPLQTVGNTETSTISTLMHPDEQFSTHQLSAYPIGNGNSQRSNYFNVELLQAACEGNSENIIISPFSVKSALTILSEGTGGNTREELLAALRLPSDPTEIHALSKEALALLQDNRISSEITLANRLWVGRGIELSGDYNRLLRTHYGGDVRMINFSDVVGAAAVINDWVRQVTRNNIQSIVDNGNIGPGTQLLLTSAIYFNGRWLKSFDATSTRTRCFHTFKTDCQEVSMMENVATYKFANIPSLDAQVVEIPYADGRLSMIAILPNKKGLRGLQTLWKDLAYTSVANILSNLQETEIILQIPKFSIESKIELRPALESLGIRDLFGYPANITGILTGSSSQVESVLHNARMDIDEMGTVAAAATVISVVPLMGSTMEVFRADRPFVVMIVDRPTASIIFAGQITYPTPA
ncbi:heparin cofactor 2 isoform X1 [Fopius arisanus]|uniref:Heparin cofactor 2 isoform X1 n=2 Tax=Fopius arisanus TaxID=64838 RepID=A0A9R1TJV0_9HYME|nr:PREDICTED: heparin cofactor 2-like isoform X1 [Fopius arisanus]